MIGEIFNLGERLAGQKDARLRRGFLLAFFEAVTVAIPHAFVLLVVQAALERRLTPRLIGLATAGIMIFALLRMLLSQAAMSDLFIAAHNLMGRTRIRAADHLRHLPMGFFTKTRDGELAGVLTTDLALVEDVWSHLIGVFAAVFILPVLVGLGLCLIDIRLGLAVMATLPIALAVLAFTTPLFTRQLGTALEAAADTNARIVEYVRGIAVLRAFGRHGEAFQRLEQSMERLRDALIRADVLPSPLLSIFGFVIEASFAVVAYVGSALVLGGSLPPATLLLFLVATVAVTRQVGELGAALLMLRAAQHALGRVDRLLSEETLCEPSSPVTEIPGFEIELDDVSFAYEDDRVLSGVSATFPERSLTAIVGASGSGKSTLLHLVARLWDLPRGQGAIRIGGVDIRDIPFEELHRHLTMVFQEVKSPDVCKSVLSVSA